MVNLTQNDKLFLQQKGISEETIERQIDCFKKGFPFIKLYSAASAEQGIMVLTPEEKAGYSSAWETYLQGDNVVLKFVPASGAASRMFKNLFEFADGASDEPDTDFIKTFFAEIHKFAFSQLLDEACVKAYGKDGKVHVDCNV